MAQSNDKNKMIKNPITVSYSESVKGWTSFKSFIPENGVSVSGNYYTFKHGVPYIHHSHEASGFNPQINTFYGKGAPAPNTLFLTF